MTRKRLNFTLTPKRKQVLTVLSIYHPASIEPDTQGVSYACNHVGYWANDTLNDLLRAGYVEVAQRNSHGGRHWRITDAGRAVLHHPVDEAIGNIHRVGVH